MGLPGAGVTPRVRQRSNDSPTFSILSLEPRTDLSGPPRKESPLPGSEMGIVTGGRLLGLLEASRGLRALWRGDRELFGRVSLTVAGSPLSPLGSFRWDRGSWEGRYRSGRGLVVRERGLLTGDPAALALQWWREFGPEPTRGDETLEVRFLALDDTPLAELSRRFSAQSPVTVCLVPSGTDPDRASHLLCGLREQEIRSAARPRRGTIHTLEIRIDGVLLVGVERGLSAIDDAASALAEGSAAEALFLAGFSDRRPRFLDGSSLVELGLGALAGGNHEVARATLEAAARTPTAAPLALLYLAARVPLSTADAAVLVPFANVLGEAAKSLRPSEPTAWFPGSARTLGLLLGALEPLGLRRLEDALRIELRRIETAGPAGRGMLPVAAAPQSREGELGSPGADARLPSASGFALRQVMGTGPLRSLHAARLIRSWMERELGIAADAPFGRIRIAPRLRDSWEALEVSGIRVGDATIRLDCTRHEHGFELFLTQQEGRLPLNVVFAPRLPLRSVARVEIGGAEAEVGLSSEGGATRIECQFPLDPSRDLRVFSGESPRG